MSVRAAAIQSTRKLASSIAVEIKKPFWVALASLVVMTTWIWGVPSSQDLSNHFRFALPFYDSLRAGYWSPGWLAESNWGYGDASFRFYPPALYYLLALLRTITGNWHAATALTATILSVIGGLGVYFWTRAIRSDRVAMWAGVFYTLAPYHLNQLFQSFMLAEFAGAAVLPFAFGFTERVCRNRRPRDVAGLAAAYAILVLTHLPLAVIGSIALFAYAILRLGSTKRLVTLGWLTLSVAIGLAASASYWSTVIFEMNWIRADNINPDPSVDYRVNFLFSSFSSSNLNVWWMNILLLVSVAMFWPALVLLGRAARDSMHKDHGRGDNALFVLGAVALLTIIMATPLSRPLWKLLRPLQQTQFPWRWLSIASMICPILLAAAIPYWKKIAGGRKRPLAFLAMGTVTLALTFSVSHIIREAFWLTPHQFEETLNQIPGSKSVSQWWPAGVHEPFRRMSSAVETDRQVTIDSWEPERRVFHVGPGPASEARIRTFYYPHWTAMAGGQNLALRPDQDGAMLVSLPENAVSVSLEFREPKRVRYGSALTLCGWISIGLLSFKRRYVKETLPLSKPTA